MVPDSKRWHCPTPALLNTHSPILLTLTLNLCVLEVKWDGIFSRWQRIWGKKEVDKTLFSSWFRSPGYFSIQPDKSGLVTVLELERKVSSSYPLPDFDNYSSP